MIIEFHGDSTCVGQSVWEGDIRDEQYPPYRIADGLLRHAVVEGHGIGGSRLMQAAKGERIYPAGSFENHVRASHAEWFVCNWGINDAYWPGLTPKQHRKHWEAVRDIVKAEGRKLVILTPNPLNNAHAEILTELVAKSRDVKGVDGLIDMHAEIFWWYKIWWEHLSDGMHPNTTMYAHVGVRCAAVLEGLIERAGTK